MGEDLLANVLLPVANEDDARTTANALATYEPAHVTVAHVIEKGGGTPDKTPVEQSKDLAADSFAAVRELFPDADTHTVYHTRIPDGIFEAVTAVDASAIAYRSRGGNRLLQFLSGDLSLKLATQAPVPVIALPRTTET